VDAPSVDDILAHPFAAPEPRDGSPPLDKWPAELTRKVALFSSLLDGGTDACAAGVPTFAKGASRWRIPLDVVPAMT